MGADIYLESVYRPHQEQVQPEFEAAIARRDALRAKGADPAAINAAQAEVGRQYGRLYERGYFRDSYNAASLFWVLGLSWWQLADELADRDGNVHPDKLKILRDRITSASFGAGFTRWERERREQGWTFSGDESSVDDWKQDFKRRRQNILQLIDEAIERNEPRYFSV